MGTELLMDLVPLALGIVLLVWSGLVVYRAVIVPRAVRKGASCGRCGHQIVVPIPERCQECGGELTAVGLATGALAVRLRGGALRAVLAWLMFAVLVGVPLRGMLEQALSRVLPHDRTVLFRQQFSIVPTGPVPAGPYQLQVEGVTERRTSEALARNGNLVMRISGPQHQRSPAEQVVYRVSDGRFECFSNGVRIAQGNEFPQEESKAMLRRVGPGFNGDLLDAHAKAIRGVLPQIAETPETPHAGLSRAFANAGLGPVEAQSGSVTSSEVAVARLPLFGPVSAGALSWVPQVLVMIAGSVWIVTRHRRLTRALRGRNSE